LGAGAEEQEQSTFLELRADFVGIYRAGLGSKPEVFTSAALYAFANGDRSLLWLLL
jgi:hypothetical protein